MTRYTDHKDSIIKDFSTCFYKIYMKEGWGIDNSCPDLSKEMVWYNLWIHDWQALQDCGDNLCELSHGPQLKNDLLHRVTRIATAATCPIYPEINPCCETC